MLSGAEVTAVNKAHHRPGVFARRRQVHRSVLSSPLRQALANTSAAMPDFMAVCEPLILAKFKGARVITNQQPAGKCILGCDCKPPLAIARAP